MAAFNSLTFLLICFYFLKREVFSIINSKNIITKTERNKLNNLVDHIYVINLKRREDKLTTMKAKMDKIYLKYEFIEAVDGTTEEMIQKFNNLSLKTQNSNDNLKNFNPITTPVELGLIFSIKKILIDVKEKNYSKILILEDDINFHKNFTTLVKKKKRIFKGKHLPYDILYLSTNQLLFSDEQLSNMHSLGYYNFVFQNKFWGAYTVVLNKKAIDILYDFYVVQEIYKMPFDNDIMFFIQAGKLKSLHLYPFMTLPDVESSDLREKRDQSEFATMRNYKISDYDNLFIKSYNWFCNFLNSNLQKLLSISYPVSKVELISEFKLPLDESKIFEEILDFLSKTEHINWKQINNFLKYTKN